MSSRTAGTNSGRTVRLPVHVGTRARKIADAERKLAAELGREPTEDEIAAAVELSPVEVADIRRADRIPASLDQGVGESGETSLGDLIARDGPGPEEEVASDVEGELVRRAVVGHAGVEAVAHCRERAPLDRLRRGRGRRGGLGL